MFEEIEKEKRKRDWRHQSNCFGLRTCTSCSCDVRLGVCCVSHEGTPRHMARLKMEQISVLRRIARVLEDRYS